MKQDIQKYKDRFLQYISAKGVDISQSPTWCLNPAHHNTETPSMIIKDDGFKCMGTCGEHGDIYDACRLITGLTELPEQFKEVERTLIGYNEEENLIIKKPKFKTDPFSVKKFEEYLRNHKGRAAGVHHFLKQRGYSPDLIKKMSGMFGYWPGLNEAEKVFTYEELNGAGIPTPTEEKPYSAWYKAGVVARLGFGYKLMYYKDDKCEKRNSSPSKTFPFPNVKKIGLNPYLTEAEMSAASLKACGLTDVYSTGGTQGLTKYNIDKLMHCESITFLYDGDNPGYFFSGLEKDLIDKKTGKIKKATSKPELLFKAGYSGHIYAVRLSESSDPDDMVREGNFDLLQELIKDKIEIFPDEEIEPELSGSEPEEPSKTESKDQPFRFLGYDEKAYYILPRNQQIPLKVNRGDTSLKNWLFELAPEEWWFEKFNTEQVVKEEIKTVFDKSNAFKWFREESYKAGMFDEKRIKGVGAHIDGEQIILNTGKDIKICGNGNVSFDDWKGENFYVKSKRRFSLSKKPWDIEKGRYLWNQLGTFNFNGKMDRVAIAGYMVISPYASILWRRPSIWITAQKGIGKSYLMENLISPAAGGDDYNIFTEGISSEAYIRQKTRRDHVPVIVDEFEAKNKQESQNMTKVMNLMRSAYGGKLIGKGSANHEAIDFSSKTMFCFGSINVRLDNDGDRTRMHICRMKESRGVCQAPTDFEGLRARTFNLLPKLIKDLDIAKKYIMDIGMNDRTGDTYAPLLAASWNLVSDLSFMAEESDDNLLRFFGEAIYELDSKVSIDDEDRIIEKILQELIVVTPSEKLTIAEMLNFERGSGRKAVIWNDAEQQQDIEDIRHEDVLARYGIRRFKKKDSNELLAISLDSSALKKILKETPFEDYKEIIQRNKLVVEKSYNVRMAGQQNRSVLLDWNGFQEKYLGEEKNNFFDD